MMMARRLPRYVFLIALAYACAPLTGFVWAQHSSDPATIATLALDQKLAKTLQSAGFTGRAGEQLTKRLGRPLSEPLANLGRALFFDTVLGLHNDNACAGCHSPLRGFGDTQPIAIGVDNNGIVGPRRTGPRNQRRAPS